MARFAAEDAAHPPPAGPVVFAGSSSFRMWDSLASDFPGVPVLNRGFGGSQVRDLAWHADQVAIRYRPRVLLLYAGENDIDAGRSPRQVLADTRVLVLALREALPDAHIVWVSIKPSPARQQLLPLMRETNLLLQQRLSSLGVVFIDVFTDMLTPQGEIRQDLWRADRLHMNELGYQIWARKIKPYLF